MTRNRKQGPAAIGRQRRAGCWMQASSSAALTVILTMPPAFTQPAQSGAAPSPENHAVQPTLRSDELWSKVLRLLNQRNGATTKEQFENVFGVRFTTVRRESDATTYLLKAGEDSYFNARVTIYNEKFKFAAPLNGAHSEWFISWGSAAGDDAKHECITAERVRADLLASGWTSPWESWGAWEESRERIAKDLQEHAPPGGWIYPPLVPEPRAGFWRRGDSGSGYRDRLPRGEVFGTGDFADSCVTGIVVTGGPAATAS